MKDFIKRWVPPALLEIRRDIWLKNNCFVGDYLDWSTASLNAKGYDQADILEKALNAILQVKSGKAVYERDTVLFYETSYDFFLLSGLSLSAASNNGKLNVLDFGGSLGSKYFQYKDLFRDLIDLRWNIVEQSHFVKCGREKLQNDNLKFYQDIDECLIDNKPNIILLSSVLQYLPEPKELLEHLSNTNAEYILIDRTPFHSGDGDRFVVQHVPPSVYSGSYPMRIFDRQKFDDQINSRWKLLTKNISPEGAIKSKSGISFTFEGLLLKKR